MILPFLVLGYVIIPKNTFSGYKHIKRCLKSSPNLIEEVFFSELKVDLISIVIYPAGICLNHI